MSHLSCISNCHLLGKISFLYKKLFQIKLHPSYRTTCSSIVDVQVQILCGHKMALPDDLGPGMLGLEAWPRPRGRKTWPRPRPRPRGLWPRPWPRPRGFWPRPRGFWPRASRPLEAYSRNGTECDWKKINNEFSEVSHASYSLIHSVKHSFIKSFGSLLYNFHWQGDAEKKYWNHTVFTTCLSCVSACVACLSSFCQTIPSAYCL